MTERAQQRTPNRKSRWKWPLILAGVVAVGLLAALGVMIATDPARNLVVADSRLETLASGQRRAIGTVRNRTDRPFSLVQVDIEFLDSAGGVVGTTSASLGMLGAGGTWRFEVPVSIAGVAGFRVISASSPDNVRDLF